MTPGRRLFKRPYEAVRSWGTPRNPGPDLSRLPVGLELSEINVAEGVRAAIASAALLVVNHWIEAPGLTLAAFSANLACFCDTGGPVRDRVPALVAFTLLGGAMWSLLGLIHGGGAPVLIPVAAAVVFCDSMARVWGLRAQAVGNVLTVVLALGVDKSLSPSEAATLFVAFLGGGAWATLLTIFIWRVYPSKAAARLLARNWRLLAGYARDIARLLGGPNAASDWDALARGDRRAIRDALEETRATLVASLRSPGPLSPQGARDMLVLEAQDGVFGALIALSHVLETTPERRTREVARRLLRRLRPLLVVFGNRDPAGGRRRADALERLSSEAGHDPALAGVATTIVERLRVAGRLGAEADDLPTDVPAEARNPLRVQVLRPLLTNLSWESAILRHAARAALLVAVAVALALAWPSPYAHWLTITVALTMQPFFAATWQRALERIAGTFLGAAIGGALTFLPHTSLSLAILLVPLSVIGFSVRQVSYGAYIACLTPLVVVLFDVAEPGHAEWVIAGMRTLYTIGGGVLAVLACMVLWPSWEPDRVERELRNAFLAHRRYADAVFGLRQGRVSTREGEEARRAAGLANNNLEAALSRALQEPRLDLASRWIRSRRTATGGDDPAPVDAVSQTRNVAPHGNTLELALTADAALRRLAGALLLLQHETGVPGAMDVDIGAWRTWVARSLSNLAERRPVSDRAPPAPPGSTLARIGQGLAILSDIVAAMNPSPVEDRRTGVLGEPAAAGTAKHETARTTERATRPGDGTL